MEEGSIRQWPAGVSSMQLKCSSQFPFDPRPFSGVAPNERLMAGLYFWLICCRSGRKGIVPVVGNVTQVHDIKLDWNVARCTVAWISHFLTWTYSKWLENTMVEQTDPENGSLTFV